MSPQSVQDVYGILFVCLCLDPTAAAMVASSLLECRDDRKRAEELAKESGDLGIEVMEYINAAGIVLCVCVCPSHQCFVTFCN